MTENKLALKLALCQLWTEYERGWGRRPDGCSLHLGEENHKKFCAAYWQNMPKDVPGEYSTENGKPFLAVVNIELYGRLEASKERQGIWVSALQMRRGAVRQATPDYILALSS